MNIIPDLEFQSSQPFASAYRSLCLDRARGSVVWRIAGMFRLLAVFIAVAAGLFSHPVLGAVVQLRKVVLEAQCDNPMELTVLNDGRVVFIERFGLVRVWKPDSRTTVTAARIPVHGSFNPSTTKGPDRGSWEAGLMGVAASPDFDRTGWLYIYYSPAGEVSENRLSRFKLEGDRLALESERVVLRVPVQREVCCHEAGSIAFDGGGNLFLSTGDNTNPFASDGFSPTDFREGRYAYDAARSSGNANDLRGKILRITPGPEGTYSIPEGNLFPPGTPKTRPEIFVMGCRNPFRIAVDPVSGILSWGDVGPDAREPQEGRGPAGFDEINRTQTAGNFGWPFAIGDNRPYRRFDFANKTSGELQDLNRPVNLSPHNTGPKELPPSRASWVAYPYGHSSRFPVVGSGGRTACAGPVYHYSASLASTRKLPAALDGCFLFYDWERHWIIASWVDAQGKPGRMERLCPEIKLKRPMEMELGPDGALYLIEFGTGWENNKDAQLIRIEGVNDP